MITLTKPYPATARERRFMETAETFISSGGTPEGLIASLEAMGSTDKIAAFEQLLAEVVNPTDRALYEAGLSVVREAL